MTQEEMISCVVDGVFGIYAPQRAAEILDLVKFGISEEDIEILKKGPPGGFDPEYEASDEYWDVWDDVLSNARFVDQDGIWYLYQESDVFLVHEDFDMEEWF